ncbi:hypothetical protein ACWKWP_10755 [Agromyces soli]
MTRRSRPRAAALVVALAGVLAALTAVPAEPTEAAWSRAETGAGAVSALTVPPPTLSACTARNVLILGAEITVTWTPAAGYASNEAEFVAGSSPDLGSALGLLSGVTTTGTTAPYTTTFSAGALSGLLGGTIYVGVRTARNYGSTIWRSVTPTATATVPAVVGTGTCSG